MFYFSKHYFITFSLKNILYPLATTYPIFKGIVCKFSHIYFVSCIIIILPSFPTVFGAASSFMTSANSVSLLIYFQVVLLFFLSSIFSIMSNTIHSSSIFFLYQIKEKIFTSHCWILFWWVFYCWEEIQWPTFMKEEFSLGLAYNFNGLAQYSYGERWWHAGRESYIWTHRQAAERKYLVLASAFETSKPTPVTSFFQQGPIS